TDATADDAASATRPLTVTWTVKNFGEGVAVGAFGSWGDTVFLSTTPGLTDPGANVWVLGSFERLHSLDSLDSYTQTRTFVLSPATKGLYVTVIADLTYTSLVAETDETNNSRTAATAVVDQPANLVVTSVSAPSVNYSGETTTVTWSVQNIGGTI